MRAAVVTLTLMMSLIHTLPSATVETGLDSLLSGQLDLLRGKRLAIVCNHTAVTSDGEHIVDRLLREEGIEIAALFGPEHGIRGTANAGAQIGDEADDDLGIPVYSLYDSTRAPTSAELADVDLIIYDIQDVGARFYTYISTLGLVMESAAANGIPVMVLDRPNPITGLHPEGPICEPSQFTFVGRYPIPVRYALTIGELAQMIVMEGWIEGAADVDLTVIPCRGWTRGMAYEDTGLPFLAPSPNIPSIDVAFAYPGTCFFEGTNVSEGRGTDTPFLLIGAPFIDSQAWISALASAELAGVVFEPVTFTPMPNAGSSNPKLMGEVCHGVHLNITDRESFRPVQTSLWMIYTLADLYPEDFEIRGDGGHFDRLWGTEGVRLVIETIIGGAPAVYRERPSLPAQPDDSAGREWRGQSSYFSPGAPPTPLPMAPPNDPSVSIDPFAAPPQFFDTGSRQRIQQDRFDGIDPASSAAAPAAMTLIRTWQSTSDRFWDRAQACLLYD